MPLYLCRWPNGDCSVVRGANKGGAIEMLDEVDNAEGCPLTPLPDFMVHFGLSDEGKIEFDCFGEATEDVLFRLVYPVLDEAMLNAASDGPVNLMPEGLAVFNEAIVQERKRV